MGKRTANYDETDVKRAGEKALEALRDDRTPEAIERELMAEDPRFPIAVVRQVISDALQARAGELSQGIRDVLIKGAQ